MMSNQLLFVTNRLHVVWQSRRYPSLLFLYDLTENCIPQQIVTEKSVKKCSTWQQEKFSFVNVAIEQTLPKTYSGYDYTWFCQFGTRRCL